MDMNFLDFEQKIAELIAQTNELKRVSSETGGIDLTASISALEKETNELTRKIFSNLGDWQVSRLSRHPMRPYTKDYISRIFTDFDELSGDRNFAEDYAIIGGTARIDGKPCMVIGHQKGRDTQEKIKRNFGMPRPEGYRKALRLMRLAERFHMPIFTFIDTPGAYPGVGAEERGQAEAIAKNLKVMSALKTPIICTVIGEGGSGGALAIGVGDRVNMLQYSTYSVISPEGCASILWKSADKASQAAEAMNITASKLQALKLIDSVVEEPLGGAHRDYDTAAQNLRNQLLSDLEQLSNDSTEELLSKRFDRLMSYGYC